MSKLSNKKKLEIAQTFLIEISNSWNDAEVEEYEATMSFNELVAEVNAIRLK